MYERDAQADRGIVGRVHVSHAVHVWEPKVMTLHSALAVCDAREGEKDGTKNSILMGDFNVKPIDGSYELLTANNLDENVFYPIPYEGTEYIVEPPANGDCYKEVNSGGFHKLRRD